MQPSRTILKLKLLQMNIKLYPYTIIQHTLFDLLKFSTKNKLINNYIMYYICNENSKTTDTQNSNQI